MKTSKRVLNLLLVAIGVLLPLPAFAHHAMGGETPQTFVQGLLSGLAHPVIGIDHFLFLLSAALLAYGLGSRSRYLTPAVFLLAGILGTGLHLAAFTVPWAPILTALSVVLAGILVLRGGSASSMAIGLFFGGAGLFHGYSYGEAIVGAEANALAAYLLGLAVVQYGVLAAVIRGLDRLAGLADRAYWKLARRLAGASALLGGALFLALNWVS